MTEHPERSDAFDPVEGVSLEDWEELNQAMFNLFKEMAPTLSFWLYNNKAAKNFMRLRFGSAQPNTGFDIVLRKWDSDQKVICPYCADPKIVEKEILIGELENDKVET